MLVLQYIRLQYIWQVSHVATSPAHPQDDGMDLKSDSIAVLVGLLRYPWYYCGNVSNFTVFLWYWVRSMQESRDVGMGTRLAVLPRLWGGVYMNCVLMRELGSGDTVHLQVSVD